MTVYFNTSGQRSKIDTSLKHDIVSIERHHRVIRLSCSQPGTCFGIGRSLRWTIDRTAFANSSLSEQRTIHRTLISRRHWQRMSSTASSTSAARRFDSGLSARYTIACGRTLCEMKPIGAESNSNVDARAHILVQNCRFIGLVCAMGGHKPIVLVLYQKLSL